MSKIKTKEFSTQNASGFDIVISPDTRCLILGSMPGVRSLQENAYYAHSQNAFWWIFSKLLDQDLNALNYAKRYDILLAHNIALWDVIQSCSRQGSLDSAIDLNSMQLNDFSTLFATHKKLTHVFCNGGLAHRLFMRHVYKPLQPNISVVKLPSTSAAYASMSRDKKLQQWKAALDFS